MPLSPSAASALSVPAGSRADLPADGAHCTWGFIDPDTPTDTVVDALVDGLLPPPQGAGATSSTR